MQKNEGAIAWMAENHVAANLLMLFCIFGGILGLRHVKQEVFPEIELDRVNISVSYPGAGPEEVEKGIIKPLEEAVGNLEGIKEINGSAGEGSGTVTVELIEGGNLQKLADDILNEVERIRTFPEDAEEPHINVVSRKRQVIDLVIHGNVDRRALHYYAEMVRDNLLNSPNITQVEVSGLPPLEITIDVSQENLRRYGLTIDEIARRVRQASLDLPFGGIKTSRGEILLRMTERRDYGKQFAQLPIINNEKGGQVTLGQIAKINDGFEDSDYFATFDGNPAVMIEVYRIGKQTPSEVAGAVKEQIEVLKQILPENINMTIMRDRSEIYAQRIDLLLRNASLGLLLVLFGLGAFLEIRLAFWVMMGIPISFLGSLIILPFTGVSLNMVSLFAYIVALGIVVDDAIVIGENIHQHREQGKNYLQAAIDGAREMATPITFSILTNIATFMPLYFMPGRMGKFFWQIPIVVVTVFSISLVESIFVLPAHLGHQKKKKEKGFTGFYHRQQQFSAGFQWLVRRVYGPLLRFILRYRYIALTISGAILALVLAWAGSGRMGFQTFPRLESDRSELNVVMPYGTPVAKTSFVAKKAIAAAKKVGDEIGQSYVTGIFAEVGRGGSHNLRIRVYLAESAERDRIGISTADYTQRWRKENGPIIGTEYSRFASDAGGPGGGAALTLELSHPDVAILKKASEEMAVAIEELQYAQDVDDGYQPGKQQLDFTVLSEGKALGFTPAQLGRQLRNNYYGAEVDRQLRGRNEIKIKVRLPESERISEHNLDEMIVHTQNGQEIMLREVATWKRGRAYTSINRRDGRRVVQVTSSIEPRSKTLEVLTKTKSEVLPEIASHYPNLSYSFRGRQADNSESIGSLRITFLFALLAVYGLLAIPFKSYVQPLIIMFSIPFGVVGAILGHYILGYTLCIPSLLGIVALSGVVVNDSLVLVECVNRTRETKTGTIVEILEQAAIQRFRPILLTTITTFCGLMPMMLETSRQARFIIPMAVSLGFGILFSTLITLGLVPCLYMVIEDCYHGVAKWKIMFDEE